MSKRILVIEDEESFRKNLLKEIKEHLETTSNKNVQKESTEYLTRAEVAELLKIDLSTLYHWTKKGKLVSYGIGNRVYYKLSDIEQAMIKLS